MALTPSTVSDCTPREDLIIDIMLLLDQAIEAREEVSTYDMASRIVELVDPTPAPLPVPADPRGVLSPGVAELVMRLRKPIAA